MATYTVTKTAQNIVFSSAAITAGSSYQVSINGGTATEVSANTATSGSMGGGQGGMGNAPR